MKTVSCYIYVYSADEYSQGKSTGTVVHISLFLFEFLVYRDVDIIFSIFSSSTNRKSLLFVPLMNN